jgi:predicted ArsR family transcriptional regulator
MGGKSRDEDSGEFTETYPLEDFLHSLEEIGPAGTTDIADRVGCDRRTAYIKLQSLEEEGVVQSQKIGNALLWQLTD